MDVHYKPDAWQEMKEGIDQITKEALMELKSANDLLEKIEAKIHSLDSDRSIHFQHTSQQGKINRLLDDYITLGNYCTKAGEAVSRHIDDPFYKDMDKFAEKMSNLSIRNYSTKNRIGSTTTTTMPNAHGYGMPQTITTKKDKITVDDIFKDSVAFDKVLHAQYQEIKKQNPDAKLDYAEYRKLVPSMRGFEYTSIEDEQKNLETWRDLGISAGIFVLTIFCPPAGITASVLYGGLELKSAYDGKDWGTGRKLSNAERVERGVFGALDAVPVLGQVAKGFGRTASSMTKLSKMQDAGKVFNPNTGKNVVQSLRDSKNIMLDRMKLGSLKVEKYGNDKMYQLGEKMAKSIDNMTAKTKSFEINGHGAITAKQGGTDLHGWVNKHHTESSKIIDDKIKSVEGSLAKGTGKNPEIVKFTEEQLSTKPPYSRDPEKWQKKGGKIEINEEGIWTYIDWEIPPNQVSYPGGFPDFKSAGLVRQEVPIGEFNRYDIDFAKADELAPNGPKLDENTWHHHQDLTTMQEVNKEMHRRFRHMGGMSLAKKLKD